MKKIFILLLLACGTAASAQFVAKMEVKEPIPGICDDKEVYALFPMFEGQVEAVAPVTKDELLKKLNEISYLKDNPKTKTKGMVSLVINCKGKVVQCEMDGNNKTSSEALDKQIVAVFNSLGEWKPGKLNGKEVDSSRLFSFKVKGGKISWD